MIQHISRIDDTLVISFPGITTAQLSCLIRRNTIPELWRAREIFILVGTNDVANRTSEEDLMYDYYHRLFEITTLIYTSSYQPSFHVQGTNKTDALWTS